MTGQTSKQSPRFVASSSRDKFAIIANNALRDKRLSYRAKGILAACLTHSENFSFNKSWILEHGTEGRDAIVAALKELRSLGYLKNIKLRDERGKILGEHYEFSDVPQAPDHGSTGALETLTPDNQRTEKPDAGFSGRIRRPIERRPIEENQETPPLPPRAPNRAGSVELPDWLEPYRDELISWQKQRAKAHPKLQRGISKISIRGLMYAKECGVLQEYCELASESTWQSLGFAGHKEYIQKLVKDKNPGSGKNSSMAPIKYTLQ